MFSKYSLWIKTASVFQIITGLIHSIGLFTDMQGQNETEKKMLELMINHKMDMGAGMYHSMMDLFLALSSCFTFLYLLGGINNFYLINKLEPSELKGYLLINIIIFGVCFGVMLFLTFLPPIILTGIVLLCLLASYFTVPKGTK
jgi:hypothetical protein